MSFHIYADDVQLYLSFQPKSPSSSSAATSVELCIQDIKSWMSANKLKLNDRETEFILLGRRNHLADTPLQHLSTGDSSAEPSSVIRNLGVFFDQELSMKSHISSVCRTAYFHLRNVARTRKFITDDAAKSLVHAFITSRIDYCNSLLFGVPQSSLAKLQHVQNSAARLVMRKKKYDHITPTLVDLHWLPVAHRIKFKLLLLIFKSLHGMSPGYICDLLQPYHPPRALRSADASLLQVPLTRLVTCGDRAFSVSGPKLWNSLPSNLRNSSNLFSFKSGLKTHLFKEAFSL